MSEENDRCLSKYYFRDFINPGKGTAFIEVKSSTYKHDGWGASTFSGTVKLADCSRSIELEFYADTEARRDKRVKKLQMIIDQLEALKRELEAYVYVPEDKELREKRDPEKVSKLEADLGIDLSESRITFGDTSVAAAAAEGEVNG
jgi:hypothetical protein